MKSSLYTCIQDIQNGDREQALALLEKFSPLLKKYAFFLQSEDALQDFQCFLLAFAKNLQLNELTISTDGAIISYINKAIDDVTFFLFVVRQYPSDGSLYFFLLARNCLQVLRPKGTCRFPIENIPYNESVPRIMFNKREPIISAG